MRHPLSLASILLAGALLSQLPVSAQSGDRRPTLYNHITGRDRSLDEIVVREFGIRYRIVEIHDSQGRYVRPGHLAGGYASPVLDEHGTPIKGYVLVLYVVTIEGKVADPVVVRATDERLREAALSAIRTARFRAATWNGKDVPIVGGEEFVFPPPPRGPEA